MTEILNQHEQNASVLPLSDLRRQEISNLGFNENEKVEGIDVEMLNEEQCRAYDIVDWHLKETVQGKSPPQLLMLIPGEGGVGKSKVIQTMSQNFERQGVSDWWVKGAYTGIVASLIDGRTLHVLAGIPVRGGRQSAQV